MSSNPSNDLAPEPSRSAPREGVRILPDGTFTVFAATALERLGYFAIVTSLFRFLLESLEENHHTVAIVIQVVFAIAIALPVVGGLIGDRVGHGRAMIAGAVLTAGSMALLIVPVEPGSFVAWIAAASALLLLVLGRGLFPVAAAAALGNLYEGGPFRVPAAGAFVVLHVGVNVGALIAPFLADALGDALRQGPGLDELDTLRLTLVFALQPVIGAAIVVAARRRVFSAAERVLRDRVRAVDPAPLADGAVRYATGAIAGLLVAYFFYSLATGHAHTALQAYSYHVAPDVGDLFVELIETLNPLLVVLLGPMAAIVLAAAARRRPLHTAIAIGIGMGLAAAGLAVFLVGVLDFPGSLADGPDFAFGGDLPAVSPVLALVGITLGEILVVPLVSAFAVSVAPRRRRGLLVGVAFVIAGLASQADRLLALVLEEAPAAGELGLMTALAGLGCVLMLVLGAIQRRDGGDRDRVS